MKDVFNRGLVKWYDRGLQNLWREFDSLIPCCQRLLKPGVAHGLSGFVTTHGLGAARSNHFYMIVPHVLEIE